MYSKINIGVIGCGKWGINHVNTAYKLLGKNLRVVCDFNSLAAVKVNAISSEIHFTTKLEDVTGNSELQAVIIATPAETHFEIAKQVIESKKHVLIEKPITLKSDDARELIRLAEVHGVHIMVGHVLLYHPAIVRLKSLVDEGKIGHLQYIYSNRLNLGTIRSEENILWSFAPHDISVIQYLTGTNPIMVDAKGADIIQSGIEDTTFTYIVYPDNIHAHIFVSWLHPFKEQRLVVIGDKGMFVFEDSLKTEKLKFYSKGFKMVNGQLEKFDSDYEVIHFDSTQPLQAEHEHFYECVLYNKAPLSDGKHALEVLKVLEMAQEKLEILNQN